jgi:hypothetical protein
VSGKITLHLEGVLTTVRARTYGTTGVARVFEQLLRMTSRIELNGVIRPTLWPEYGALSVPFRLSKLI